MLVLGMIVIWQRFILLSSKLTNLDDNSWTTMGGGAAGLGMVFEVSILK